MDPIRTENDLDALSRAARAWAVLLAWGELGLFDALADGAPRAPAQLPGDERAVSITAPILGHLGLLTRHRRPGGDAWALSDAGRRLVEETGLSLGPASALADLARLPEVMRTGAPCFETSGGVVKDDPERSRRFMDMLWRRSAAGAAETARLIGARRPAGAALDLGGGHGRYGAELADRGFDVTLFDRAICVGFARERHGDRFAYRSGDFTAPGARLGGPYDVALLSNIVHGLSEAELDGLLPRLREALRPGGLLVLKDMFLDDTGCGPEVSDVFGLSMLMCTAGGRSYAVDDMRRRLRAAGFASAEHVGVPYLSFSLLFAS